MTYGDIKLDAAEIELDMNSSTVYAVGRTDSVGAVEGSPVFNDRGTEYQSQTCAITSSQRRASSPTS